MHRMLLDEMIRQIGPMIFALLILGGCGEKDVAVIVDEDELIRYMSETGDGRELFRTEGLISNTPYLSPDGSITITDSILDLKRIMKVFA